MLYVARECARIVLRDGLAETFARHALASEALVAVLRRARAAAASGRRGGGSVRGVYGVRPLALTLGARSQASEAGV
jgi:hypothetical protein